MVCESLELTDLMLPFELEIWYGERMAVLGSNGSGKSHFLLLLDEPTDNLDLISAEALQQALETFDGTVLAITHDRWFASCSFDRYLIFGVDSRVRESAEPVWDESRVTRAR